MNADFVNLLLILVYLIFGTFGIALLVGWALKCFDRQAQATAHDPSNLEWRRCKENAPRQPGLVAVGLMLATIITAFLAGWLTRRFAF